MCLQLKTLFNKELRLRLFKISPKNWSTSWNDPWGEAGSDILRSWKDSLPQRRENTLQTIEN